MPIQRTVLWIVFLMSILFLWDKWMSSNGKPSLFSPAAQSSSAKKDSSTNVESKVENKAENKAENKGTGSAEVPAATSSAKSNANAIPGAAPVVASNAVVTQAPSKIITLKSDVLSLSIDTLGGQIKRSELLAHKDTEKKESNFVLLTEEPGKVYLAQSGLTGPEGNAFPNHRTLMQVKDESQVAISSAGAASDKAKAVFVVESGGVRLTRTYTLTRSSYVLDVTDEVANIGAVAIAPALYMQLARDTHKLPGESQFYSTYTGPAIYTEQGKFQKVDFGDIEKKKTDHVKSATDGWAGIIQHYFVTAWIPADKTNREFYTNKIEERSLYTVGMKQPIKELAPGASATIETRLYVGPQDQQAMAKVAPGLDLTVDYGWLTAVAKPIFSLMQYLHGVVGNWGWAIVLLTIVIKTIFFPLQAASYKSMARMKAVTPKMTALRERFKDDRVKLNQGMMELYKTEKINPLGGCLPVVVQIPVFIALYWVLLASVEMRNAPWILWIKDLAAPDPWYILPLLMAGTMFIQMRLNPTPPDPIQARMMQIMPIVFSVMFFFFPAGLVLYWLVNNLYSIAQQWYITKRIESGVKS
jgi:YidC/Oxa1 family membrane protein insertase